jgi:hypothetical protein
MSALANKLWALAGLTLCAPPLLLALALVGRSSNLLIVGFAATILALFINSLLFVGLLVFWFVGNKRVEQGKPIVLISLVAAGIIADIVILGFMPPLAK